MVIKFQIQLTFLLFFITTSCFSSAAVQIGLSVNPLTSEERALKFIEDHDTKRCTLHTETPGEIANYQENTI
ncbi:MAG: hypothetical protein V4544_04585 [Pseudomonadota bacterium]